MQFPSLIRVIGPFRGIVLFLFVLSVLIVSPADAQRDLTDIPDPDPVAEKAVMKIDPEAEVNLYAADPEIRKPIQVNFDSTGGLWVASSEVYPQIQPGEKANDKIIVLRDTDGDGIADRSTVFADGLLIPTGILPDGPNAAYVAESTRLVHLRDTDGDGKSDVRRVVLSGFGTEDTHHLIHTLRWGPDGCLYFNQSIYIHSHIDTPYGTRHLDGGGIWRYRPDTGRLEVFCKGFVNPWGHVFDPFGESFATDGAYGEGINYVFPDSVFVSSPGGIRFVKGLNPGSPKHCGLEILSGTHVPPNWSGDFVTNDFRGHRVCRFSVKPSGSGYVSRQQPEIITSSHVAFRPIDAKMGPDGALYLADWYNPIIQHGEVDFRDERRDRKHGRVWRVSFPGRELDPWPDFAKQNDDQLFELLEDPALPVRQFARQELWGRAKDRPKVILRGIKQWRDAGDAAARSLEVLWMQEVIGEASVQEAEMTLRMADEANHPARRTMLRSVWRSRVLHPADSDEHKTLSEMVLSRVDDEDARIRLEAVVSNGQASGVLAADRVVKASSRDVDANLDFAIWQSLRELSKKHEGSILAEIDWSERWDELAFAVISAGNPQAAETAVLQLNSGSVGDVGPLVSAVSRVGDARQLGRVLEMVLRDDQFETALPSLLERTSRDGTIPHGAGEMLLKKATASNLADNSALAKTIARAAAAWKASELEPIVTELIADAKGDQLQVMISALGAFDSATSRSAIDRMTRDKNSEIRIAATRALTSNRPFSSVKAVVGLLGDEATGDVGQELVGELVKRKGLPKRIAAELKPGGLSPDRARELLRTIRRSGGNAELEKAVSQAGRLEDAGWKLSPELSKRIIALLGSEGSAARGESIYRRPKLQCIQCHAIGSAGGLVGPNLISVGGSSQPDYILESLLDPNAKLKEGYTTVMVLTLDDEIVSGILVGKTDDSIRLRLADGKERDILLDDIAQQKPGKTLMPEGTLDGLTQQELVDLTAFLAALGRDPEFTVSTSPMIRSFESLVYTNEAHRRLNRTSSDTASTDDPALLWKPMTSKVNGTLPAAELDQFKPHRQSPPTSFVRFSIRLPEDGVAGLSLVEEGVEAWVDGKPTPVDDLEALRLKKGDHRIVLSLDRSKLDELTVRLGGDAVAIVE